MISFEQKKKHHLAYWDPGRNNVARALGSQKNRPGFGLDQSAVAVGGCEEFLTFFDVVCAYCVLLVVNEPAKPAFFSPRGWAQASHRLLCRQKSVSMFI